MVPTWRNSDDKDEVLVPESLRVVLWITRTIGVAPARLRRACAGWQLSVSSSLIKLQRIIFIINSILILSMLVIKIIWMNNNKIHGSISYTNFLLITELALLLTTYVLGVWSAPDNLKAVKSLIWKTQKINNSFNYEAFKRKNIGATNSLYIVYAIWQVLTAAEHFSYTISKLRSGQEYHVLEVIYYCLSVVFYYSSAVGQTIRMTICAVILELKFTLTLLNDKLENLLQIPPPMPPRDIKLKLYLKDMMPQKANISGSYSKDARPLEDSGSIRHINRCHDMVCDMVARVDQLNGPFLLFYFMLLFLQLLITPQIVIAGLDMSAAHVVLRQSNRILGLFSDLLILVEPCHCLQVQMNRTRCVLGKLVGQEQRCGFDPAHLDLFILQAQMRDVAVAPMGVITVGRPLVASIIGGVVTYLIIVIQNRPESDSL